MAESEDGSRMDLEPPHGGEPLWRPHNLYQIWYESIAIRLCSFKPLRFPSLTAVATNVNYPDEYKGLESRHNSNIWKEKKISKK